MKTSDEIKKILRKEENDWAISLIDSTIERLLKSRKLEEKIKVPLRKKEIFSSARREYEVITHLENAGFYILQKGRRFYLKPLPEEKKITTGKIIVKL